MKVKSIGKTLLCAAAIALCGIVSVPGGLSASADVSPALCDVNGVSYRYFDEALAAWKQGTTLKLLADCPLSELKDVSDAPLGLDSLSVTETKTLDLNGKTLSGTEKSSVLYISGAGVTFTLTDSSAAKNGKITGGSSTFGGGINVSGATLNFNGGAVTGNSGNSGGGIYASDAAVNLGGGTIEGNTADFGGGLYLFRSSLELGKDVASSVSGNTATTLGGGIYAYGTEEARSVLTLNGGKIDGNTAAMGGGIAVWQGASVLFGEKAEISGNHADGGAGVYLFGKTAEKSHAANFEMNGGTISSNVGGKFFGGGVKVGNGAIFKMTAGSVTGNSTQANGGGISAEEGAEVSFGKSASVKQNVCGSKENNVFYISGCKLSIGSDFSGALGLTCLEYGKICDKNVATLNGIVADDPDFEIYAQDDGIYCRSYLPVRLYIEKMPAKLTYSLGETPDLSGMVVKVVYKDKREVEVKDYTFDEAPFAEGNAVRRISYTANGVTLSAQLAFSLNLPTVDNPQPQPDIFPGGFIAVVVLSALFVAAVIFVAIYTNGFRGRKKKQK